MFNDVKDYVLFDDGVWFVYWFDKKVEKVDKKDD